MADDWGPISKLADAFAGIGSSVQAAEGHARLWRSVVRNHLRLQPPPPPADVRPAWIRAGAALIARLTSWIRSLIRRHRDDSFVEVNVGSLLIECIAWLAKRNMKWGVTEFAPFWRDMPIGVAAVTENAVLWAVMANWLERYGPELTWRWMESSSLPAIAGEFPATTGDLFSLHLNVERLVQRITANASQAEAWSEIGEVRRRPGGWRRKEFIDAYPRLRVATSVYRNRNEHQHWLSVIDVFINASPMTRLVYVDLVTRGDSIEAARAIDIDAEGAQFLPLVRLSPTSDSQSSQPIRGWRELWYSHLAKSMVGAVLSPPPGYELRRWHENYLTRLKKQYTQRVLSLPSWTKPHNDATCCRLQAEMQTVARYIPALEAREHLQRFPRLVALHAIVGPRPNLDGQGNNSLDWQSKRCLQMRFLDMLVRHVAASNAKAIESNWRLEKTPHSQRRADVLMSPDGVLSSIFANILFGGSISQVRDLLGRAQRNAPPPVQSNPIDTNQIEATSVNEEGAEKAAIDQKVTLDAFDWFQFHCDGLLNTGEELIDHRQRSECANTLRDAVGISEQAATLLVRRFADDEAAGVEVGFQGSNPHSYAPATLLAGWTSALTDNLLPDEASPVN